MKPAARHTQILRHMLGMDDPKFRGWTTRNYFATYANTDDYKDLRAMERLGLVKPGIQSPSGMCYFNVTDAGAAALSLEPRIKGYITKEAA